MSLGNANGYQDGHTLHISIQSTPQKSSWKPFLKKVLFVGAAGATLYKFGPRVLQDKKALGWLLTGITSLGLYTLPFETLKTLIKDIFADTDTVQDSEKTKEDSETAKVLKAEQSDEEEFESEANQESDEDDEQFSPPSTDTNSYEEDSNNSSAAINNNSEEGKTLPEKVNAQKQLSNKGAVLEEVWQKTKTQSNTLSELEKAWNAIQAEKENVAAGQSEENLKQLAKTFVDQFKKAEKNPTNKRLAGLFTNFLKKRRRAEGQRTLERAWENSKDPLALAWHEARL